MGTHGPAVALALAVGLCAPVLAGLARAPSGSPYSRLLLARAHRASALAPPRAGVAMLSPSSSPLESADSADYSSEIDGVPLWVAERPLLPGFQERATIEVTSWWYSHGEPEQIARVATNSTLGTLVHAYTMAAELGQEADERAVVMQARIRVKVCARAR
jgi:hypothetical protein